MSRVNDYYYGGAKVVEGDTTSCAKRIELERDVILGGFGVQCGDMVP